MTLSCANSKLDNSFQKKFQVKWEDPFKVESCFPNGTYQIANLDGTLHASRVNGLHLKIYHALVVKYEALGEEVMPLKEAKFFDVEGV